MKVFHRWFHVIGAVLLLGAARPAANPEGFVVVVHADNPATSVKRDELSRIFFKRQTRWPTGVVAEPLDLSTSQVARVFFTSAVHGKSVGAVRAFWQQQIFSGRDVPPPEKGSEREVLAYVAEHPGAVGYVSANTPLIAGVKTIQVEGLSK
jgi:ABC-type phosphate transport system substrate-binding protein